MAELTLEQVKQASEAWIRYVESVPSGKPFTEFILRSIAPCLQLPWDEPTMHEANAIEDKLVKGVDVRGQVFTILFRFITMRNAALLPKPVDPRKKIIMAVFDSQLPSFPASTNDDAVGKMADRILAALGEVK